MRDFFLDEWNPSSILDFAVLNVGNNNLTYQRHTMLYPKIVSRKKHLLNSLLLVLLFQNAQAQSSKNFDNDVEKYAQSLKLPTLAIAVAKGDSLIYFKGIGSVAANTQIPITTDAIFPVASVTKSFTSVLLQQLEAEGKIALTDLVDKYPNQYFTKERWTENTTLAHIISHTSESRPVGTNFIYNGSKYNVVFNVFSTINPPITNESMTRPFTKEMERRILIPLQMDHTLVRYDAKEHSHLEKYAVTPYNYIDSTNTYQAQKIDLTQIECGPGFGMLSSVKDLLKYSNALDNEILISKQRFKEITTPFYKNSVQGQGWFSCKFEGIDLNWAYGYGSNDAALLLKVPSKNLTFVLLSSCSMPSATTRLGYGNPLNSPLVCSFLRNFILNQPAPIQLDADVNNIVDEVKNKVIQNKSRIHIEEAFATITVSLFSPITSEMDKKKNIQLLNKLTANFPNDAVWKSPTAFELMASLNDPDILNFASNVSKSFSQRQNLHPATLFFAGVIQEKVGNTQNAILFLNRLAEGDAYNEQGYKYDALMKLAKHFEKSNPNLSKKYLSDLIKYKERISAQDAQYKEAKAMYSQLGIKP